MALRQEGNFNSRQNSIFELVQLPLADAFLALHSLAPAAGQRRSTVNASLGIGIDSFGMCFLVT
jgi:hypothetical protein